MCTESDTYSFFFFNDTATTEIYTLSLHDALPISGAHTLDQGLSGAPSALTAQRTPVSADRKSTRLNSSHSQISYAVFCLKKKKTPGTLLPPSFCPGISRAGAVGFACATTTATILC